MKTIFFGSPDFAIPALDALIHAGHDVAAVYTRPDRPAGRSRDPVPTPVRAAATERGIETRTPPSLRAAQARDELRATGADAFVVAAYGRLLPPEVLAIPRLGVVNIHPSLLPRYRGPSPVAGAILDGAEATGVTIMLLDEGMDTGPVLAQSEPAPLRGDETAGELTRQLFVLGAQMLPEVLQGLDEGTLTPQPQDGAQATVTKLLSRDDGRLDWSQTAVRIERMVRAYDPWPGTHTTWNGRVLDGLRAALANAGVATEATGVPLDNVARATPASPPGRVTVQDGRIFITTGLGALELLRLQLEGRRALDTADFLRGNPAIASATLPS